MDFILSYNNREGVMVFPVVPNEAIVLQRTQKNETFDSVSGEMQALGPLNLASFELEGIFPLHEYRFLRPGSSADGWSYVRTIEAVRARRIPFRGIHLDNDGREIFNLPLSVEAFEYRVDQAGDISYRLSFREYRFAESPLSATLPAQKEPEGRMPTTVPAPLTAPLTDSQAEAAGQIAPAGGSGRTIVVPESANQGGLCRNYEPFARSWASGTTQRKLNDIWVRLGRPSQGGVAMINGYYCVAMTTKFGMPGDLLQINLEGGGSFNAIITDSKGANPGINPHPGESGNEWGHYLNYPGQGKRADIVEWLQYDGDPKTLLTQKGWLGKKVTSVINFGQASL